jgi:HAE1 family hydrophobic/amphiphilic exporter-1
MSNFFIRRPIVAMVISIVTVLLGVVAMRTLPISQYPDITPPLIKVNTTFNGASGVDVEQSVATPIEQQVNGVEKMIYMKSINANDGTMELQVSFDVGADLDNSNVLTQNRVSQAQASLPPEVKQEGVTVKKAFTFPLVLISLESPEGKYDASFLANYATLNVNDQVARLTGIGDVKLFGSSNYAMRVWLRPDRLRALGVTASDVADAIKAQNQIQAGGQVGGPPAPKGTEFTYNVRGPGRLAKAEDFSSIVIRAGEDGSLVRIGDVGRVELGTQLYNAISRVDGKPAAVIAVYQLPGSNALDVAANIRKTMDELKKDFPAGMDYRITLDTTAAITAGIDEIIKTLFEALGLVLIVVFLFLQNWRATLIPLLTVPVSLVGAFLAFPSLKFSINVLSLLGLVLAIGLVVDDAIVVVEAVVEKLEHGMTPVQAAREAMHEVSGPVVAIALVLAGVFIPVAFISGLTGRLYQQFAVTIAISVLISAFNALTLSPALSALLLKAPKPSKSIVGRFFAAFNRGYDWVRDRYVSLVRHLCAHPIISVLATVGILAVAFFLGSRLPAGFLPDEDNGYFTVDISLPEAASLERTDAITRRVDEILRKTPGVEVTSAITGISLLTGPYITNTATIFLSLKPWEERKSKSEVAAAMILDLNKKLAAAVPEARVLVFGPPPIPGLGNASGFTMQLQDKEGKTPEYLDEQSRKFIAAAKQKPEIGNLSTTYAASVPQFRAEISRDRALTLGVPYSDVMSTMGALLGGTYVNDFNRFGRTYRVYLQAEPPYRATKDSLASFFVRAKDGGMVPLDALVSLKQTTGPAFTNRFNLYRAAELNGTPAEGVSSGEALDALEATARDSLPPGMAYTWANTSFQEKKAAGTAGIVLIFALFLVFLILAAQYESWSLPVSVLLGAPPAILGAYLGLVIARLFSRDYVNNVFAQIGLIMLVGLAAKNAILIVEFAKVAHDKGMSPVDAAIDAAKLRLRPILMTAFAFILGVVPLVRAVGAGAQARKVMGMAVFTGMIVATVLGVLTVPALYVWVTNLTERKKKKEPAPAPAVPHQVSPEVLS